FLLAVARASEIIIGITCAGVVLAGTDLGGARRRLAAQFADLCGGIAAGFIDNLARAGREFADTRPMRREVIRRIIGLDPVLDQTLGESAQIRYHSPVLQSAVDGLFRALGGWRAVAHHIVGLHPGEAQQQAAAILETVPQELRAAQPGASARWLGG